MEGRFKMSLYYYLASKQPLPVVNRKPIQLDTVTDLGELDIDVQFEILPCRTNPPIAAGGQIQKRYVYKVRGRLNKTFLGQLVAYIKENVKEQNKVEFWSVWHSEKVPSNNIYRLNPNEVTIEEIRFLENSENSCIKFFPKNQK